MTYIVLKAPLNSNQPTNQPCHIWWGRTFLAIRGEKSSIFFIFYFVIHSFERHIAVKALEYRNDFDIV